MRRTPLLAIASARSSSTGRPDDSARWRSRFSVRSVAVAPGWMALTLTPSRMPSRDRPLLKFASAELTDPPIRNSGSTRARRAADDVDDVALRRLQERPKQPRQPHGAEEFERKAVEPQIVRRASRKSPARVAPAQFTSTSQRLKRSLTRANTCSQPASVRRSAATVMRLGPAGFDDGPGGRRQVGGRRCGEHALRARAREVRGYRPADAAACARNDDDLPLKLSRHADLSLTVRPILASRAGAAIDASRFSATIGAGKQSRRGDALKPAPFGFAKAKSVDSRRRTAGAARRFPPAGGRPEPDRHAQHAAKRAGAPDRHQRARRSQADRARRRHAGDRRAGAPCRGGALARDRAPCPADRAGAAAYRPSGHPQPRHHRGLDRLRGSGGGIAGLPAGARRRGRDHRCGRHAHACRRTISSRACSRQRSVRAIF